MIELEKTYLAKKIPDDLLESNRKEIIDVYIPASSVHPALRLRKNGDKFEMTKKQPINEGNKSIQLEQTIVLTEEEFRALEKIEGKRVSKMRYKYQYQNNEAEIDVFQEGLTGLVLIDFEFKTEDEMKRFEIPEFCLVEVTQEEFIAGGMLCGKTYADIADELAKFEYEKILQG